MFASLRPRLRDRRAGLLVLGVAVLVTSCGPAARSLSAADDAIRTQDDFVRATEGFTPPWTVQPVPPPTRPAVARTVTPVVENGPGRLESVISKLRFDEAQELIGKGACALLKYQLEYSETPSVGEIEDYLIEVSAERAFTWLTPEDHSFLAGELETAATDVAALGLPPDDFRAFTELVCEVVG